MEAYLTTAVQLIPFLAVGLIFAYYDCFCGKAPSRDTLKMQGKKKGVTVIDCRSQSEWDAGHVDDSLAHVLLIPLPGLGTSSKLPADKDTPILIHCAVGGRSARGKVILESMGYTDVVNSMTITGTEEALKAQ